MELRLFLNVIRHYFVLKNQALASWHESLALEISKGVMTGAYMVESDKRYSYAEGYLSALQNIWTKEELDLFWDIHDVINTQLVSLWDKYQITGDTKEEVIKGITKQENDVRDWLTGWFTNQTRIKAIK